MYNSGSSPPPYGSGGPGAGLGGGGGGGCVHCYQGTCRMAEDMTIKQKRARLTVYAMRCL